MKTILLLHGWGRDKQAMMPLANLLGNFLDEEYQTRAIDLPGFGETLAPEDVWSPSQYADYVAKHCKKMDYKNLVVVGHSFGGKVGALMALRHPQLVDRLVMIGASGLKRKRSIFYKVKAFGLKMLGRMAGLCDRFFKTSLREAYRRRFGSADYRAARGVMKDILVRTVNEDISNQVREIKQKTLLIYGDQDCETPAKDIGKRYQALINDAELIILNHYGHNDILDNGRFLVQKSIERFLKEAPSE